MSILMGISHFTRSKSMSLPLMWFKEVDPERQSVPASSDRAHRRHLTLFHPLLPFLSLLPLLWREYLHIAFQWSTSGQRRRPT